ncbi:DNA repair protein RecN [Lachnospiraceae bacterium 46-15]
MLWNIHVKNMALIQEADVELSTGLNILTGETGAGKSIIIGAVNVALGAAGFKGFAREDAEYALVELVFSVENEKIRQRLEELEVPVEDGQVIISRKLAKGRTISKINGETVTVSRIREAAEVLLDIHGQHEHQSLLYRKNHLAIVDEYAKEELEPYAEKNEELYKRWQRQKRELAEMQTDENARAKEADFLRFEIEEIEAAALIEGEDESLEEQYRRMVNGRRIAEAAAEISALLSTDGGASEMTGRAIRSLCAVAELDRKISGLNDQLYDIDSLLNDFNRELSDYVEGLSFDEGEFSRVEARLDLINHLKSKYGNAVSEILAYQEERQERLNILENYEACLLRLQKELASCEAELFENAGRMSKIRKKYASDLSVKIKEALEDLNFLDVQFEITFERLETPGLLGIDDICFMISTNPGSPVKPLNEVASGGELSRIMLALKAVLADKDATETLIFDEIDVGISGRTAQKVSEKMAVLAKRHQVICITHLAQIASMADSHYVIEKKVENQVTSTSIRKLSDEESVEELARILGGAEITPTVLKGAREMKELASQTKKD